MDSQAQQLLGQATRLHQAGELAPAEALYRQILARYPDAADALHLLGLLMHQRGDSNQAVQLIERAIAIRADIAEFHVNLGNVLLARRLFSQAVEAYRRGIALKPTLALAHSNLGVALHELRQFEPARQACQRAIELQPQFPEAHFGLANALLALGETEIARRELELAIQQRPNYVKALRALAELFQKIGRFTTAADLYQRVAQLAPQDAELWHRLGMAMSEVGDCQKAIDGFRRALALNPTSGATWNNLGNELRQIGQLEEAMACLQRALASSGNQAGIHNNIANVLRDRGLALDAVAHLRRAIELDPSHQISYSSLLLMLHYDSTFTPDQIFAEHLEWARRFAQRLAVQRDFSHIDRAPDRRLRIGYVSGDLRTHPVASFMEPVFRSHDPKQVEVIAYSTSTAPPDEVTARFKAHAHAWRDIAHLDAAQLAALIGEDRIDILVDLSGHTPGNRLLSFACKPAPVQVTHQGYPDTTGVGAIDCRLTDANLDPVGVTDRLHVEKLVRLPRILWCYEPWTQRPVSALPARARGPITFGSLNTLVKITPAVMDVWARILNRVERSRLVLLVSHSRAEAAQIRDAFAQRGIDPQRLELLGRRSHEQYMAAFDEIDLTLDPFPYNGQTTTCNSLWMGVPVVTLAGMTHVRRAGLAILRDVGLPELVTDSTDSYIDSAVNLASDLDRLHELRLGLRERMRGAPLMDAPGLTRAIEQAFREMWHKWCASVA